MLKSTDYRNATQAELLHLVGEEVMQEGSEAIGRSLDSINKRLPSPIKYVYRHVDRDPRRLVIGINVEYNSLPEVYRQDMKNLLVTL